MDKTQLLPVLIQAGAVGISLALIYVLLVGIKMIKELIGNHISHSTKVQIELVTAIKELTTLIREKLK